MEQFDILSIILLSPNLLENICMRILISELEIIFM